MAARLVPSLVLVAALLAGCITVPDALDAATAQPRGLDALTAPIHDVVLRDEAVVEGEDDTRIWLDVYRPETDAPVPTILVMTPYQALGDALSVPAMLTGGCDATLPQECPYEPFLVDFFVLRGYAVAFSDVRGNHNSGGCIDQSGPKQWQDGYNTVEWLAAQSWSNGKVGMIGVSYDGESQQTTALLAPPSLATIVPIASVAGQYDYSYFQGVPYHGGAIGSMAAYAAISAVPGQDPMALPHYAERLECQDESLLAAADLSGDMTTFWQEREYRPHAANVTTSVLHIHGLADWNVKPIHIDGWYNELVNAEHKRAIYGQWGHNWPQREDWNGEAGILHRWMDHFLHGIDTGILQELPPVLIQDTDEQWRGIDSFPPLAQPWQTLHLNADLALADAAGQAGEHVIYDVPRDHVNEVIPRRVMDPSYGLSYGAKDAPYKLVFDSEPLDAPMRLTGVPRLTFNATTDATSTHWAAILEIVHPDGTTAWLNRGYQDTRHLAGLTNPQDLTPGESYFVDLKMFPQDDVVPAGATLRLTLTNEDDWVMQDTTYATSIVQLGAGGATLHLPLDPVGQAYPDDALVAWSG